MQTNVAVTSMGMTTNKVESKMLVEAVTHLFVADLFVTGWSSGSMPHLLPLREAFLLPNPMWIH